LLVERLGLHFGSVSTALSGLDGADARWWVLGKLHTYRQQREPFVHFDNDVFLWKPLPQRLLEAPVIGQNPEHFAFDDEGWYRPVHLQRAIASVHGWAPEEWLSFLGSRGAWSVCCGILGGTATGFISHYADQAIQMVCHPSNQAAWTNMGDVVNDNILVEQYFLAACLDFHVGRSTSRFWNSEIRYLFPSTAHAFNEAHARLAGYTHLIGGAKRNRLVLRRLEERVRHEYPEKYERCVRQANGTRGRRPDSCYLLADAE
jgi:hypothetical protein